MHIILVDAIPKLGPYRFSWLWHFPRLQDQAVLVKLYGSFAAFTVFGPNLVKPVLTSEALYTY